MTEDEKDQAMGKLMDRIGAAVEKVATAWELRCQAAAKKDDQQTAAFEKLIVLVEGFGPMLAGTIVEKVKKEVPPS